MHQDKAIGMFMGLFIGDALGAPLEFIRPHEMSKTLIEMEGGGVHNTAEGEWTDDGAMAVAIADAYISNQYFNPETIAFNFKMWKKTGHFGTRDYVFDIGRTCSEAIDRMAVTHPYAGSCSFNASGNGSIMRVAPIVLANHNNLSNAVAQAVAVSLMTHGNIDTINYISGFVTELMSGKKEDSFNYLRYYRDPNSGGTIMHAYITAWECVEETSSFEKALIMAVNKGYDADTVGAVTGMLAGRKYGLKGIPTRWLDKLVKKDELIDMAEKLYALGGDDGTE
jgi:ADP-ribosyl-[dinitrogen reductase] hydrolase